MEILVLELPLSALWLISSILVWRPIYADKKFTVHCTSNYLPTCKQIYPAFRPVYWQTSFPVTYFCRTRTRGQWHTLAQSRPHPGSSRSSCHYPPQCHCPFRCQFLSKWYQMFIKIRVHRCIHFIKENRCIFSLWVLIKWKTMIYH